MRASWWSVPVMLMTASPAVATDYTVEFRCVQGEYRIEPNPVVLIEGQDRVVFRTADYESGLPCAVATNSPTLEIVLWGPFEPISLWYYDSTSPVLGPFCEAGVRSYTV